MLMGGEGTQTDCWVGVAENSLFGGVPGVGWGGVRMVCQKMDFLGGKLWRSLMKSVQETVNVFPGVHRMICVMSRC